MRVVLTILLASCFAAMILISVQKQWSGETWVKNEVIEVEKVLYPSVSVCRKYPFNTDLSPALTDLSGNFSTVAKLSLAMDNVWQKEKLFYFVNHPGTTNDTFPCAVFGGSDAGTLDF